MEVARLERLAARHVPVDDAGGLFAEQWARLIAHAANPATLNTKFWTNFPSTVERGSALRVKRRLDALGLQCRWDACSCYGPCACTNFYIHPARWCLE